MEKLRPQLQPSPLDPGGLDLNRCGSQFPLIGGSLVSSSLLAASILSCTNALCFVLGNREIEIKLEVYRLAGNLK